jgi:hypothetical protein
MIKIYRHLSVHIDFTDNDGFCFIKYYPYNDPIWYLEDDEKVKRKALADMQRIMIDIADKSCHNKVVERG